MSAGAGADRVVRIALVQEVAGADAGVNLAATEAKIRGAAAAGARIVCTQELFLTPYFCHRQDPAAFDLAEPVPGPSTARLGALAAELGVVVVASLFERRASGVCFHNTAAVIDADGTLLGRYRKMHIPQDPGFEEKYYFAPGDLGFQSWKTAHGAIGVVICWDQWFPEAARLTALAGAEVIFCPTAIGWQDEGAETARAQHDAWEIVQRGHAAANACFWAAANRTGAEAGATFWGQSFVADFNGRTLARAPADSPALLLADCDLGALREHRRTWPFFRDRRTDAYGGLSELAADPRPGP